MSALRKDQVQLFPEKRALVLPAGYLTEETLSHVSRWAPLNGGQVVVSHDLQSAIVAHRAGTPIPHPMVSQYSWPHPPYWEKVMRHQIATAAFCTLHHRCFVFNEIGTAKTASVLWAADWLKEAGVLQGPVLILSTLSTLHQVWAEGIKELFGRKYRSIVLHGGRKKRFDMLREQADFYILNHDGLKVLGETLSRDLRFKLVVVDEGAEFSNDQTARWEALNRFLGPQTTRSVWWMTGSPIPNSPMDAFGQAKIICPDNIPKYRTKFKNEIMVQINDQVSVPKLGWEKWLFSRLQPAIRFRRQDCIDLPPCTTEIRKVDMTAEQQKAYDQMAKTLRAELASGTITAFNEGVKATKLAQIASGVVYDRDGEEHTLHAKYKLEELVRLINDAGRKAIVFCPFRHIIHDVERHLEKRFTVGLIHGEVSPKQREFVFDAFRHGTTEVLLAHPKTMAHGLNLTVASTAIWYGPVNSHRIYEQANGRITRPGQRANQLIIHLESSAIEHAMFARLKRKESMQGIFLEMFVKEGK